jgi:hypothetical protein
VTTNVFPDLAELINIISASAAERTAATIKRKVTHFHRSASAAERTAATIKRKVTHFHRRLSDDKLLHDRKTTNR